MSGIIRLAIRNLDKFSDVQISLMLKKDLVYAR